jgi:hypothetical protein
LLLIALSWLAPLAWDLALVYLHPLVALWLLDRELLRSRPEWRRAYHLALCCVPVCLAGLWLQLHAAPHLPGDDALSWRIAQHAGADFLRGVSSRFLVAAHAFLEVVHYAVWLLAIPCCAGACAVERMPLARRSPSWLGGLRLFLAAGAGVVVLLWAGFLIDYPATRDVYFTLAMAHVLAEAPLLLRAL